MPSSFMCNLPADYLVENPGALSLHSLPVGAGQGNCSMLSENNRVAGARSVLDRGGHAERRHLGTPPSDVRPEGLLGHVSAMPCIDQEPRRADEVRRPAHQEDK